MFKVTPELYTKMAQRAEKNGVCLSAWVRSLVSQVVASKESKGHLRIREPNGTTI